MDPYKRLALPASVDDDQVKAAYLSKVKQFMPERYPQEFQQIQSAYQLLKDQAARVKYQLLNTPTFDPQLILSHCLPSQNRQRPTAAQLINLLENSNNHAR